MKRHQTSPKKRISDPVVMKMVHVPQVCSSVYFWVLCILACVCVQVCEFDFVCVPQKLSPILTKPAEKSAQSWVEEESNQNGFINDLLRGNHLFQYAKCSKENLFLRLNSGIENGILWEYVWRTKNILLINQKSALG